MLVSLGRMPLHRVLFCMQETLNSIHSCHVETLCDLNAWDLVWCITVDCLFLVSSIVLPIVSASVTLMSLQISDTIVLSVEAQMNTQVYGRRPYGVGLLVAGYDETGTHLYESSPSGNCFDYFAIAIGARSQSARTFLENKFQEFSDLSLDDLIVNGLFALRDTLQQDKELNLSNISIGIVGKDTDFHVIENDQVQRYLDLLTERDTASGRPRGGRNAPAAAADEPAPEDAPAAMETD